MNPRGMNKSIFKVSDKDFQNLLPTQPLLYQIINDKGPKMDPCGTTMSIFNNLDKRFPKLTCFPYKYCDRSAERSDTFRIVCRHLDLIVMKSLQTHYGILSHIFIVDDLLHVTRIRQLTKKDAVT